MVDGLIALADTVYWQPWVFVRSLGEWQTLLVISILLMLKLVFGGWMMAKGGRSPLWALVMLANGADLLALWIFAYVRWPFVDRRPAPGAVSEPTDAATD